jgi:DNA-binding NtrC family response regulator
MEDDAMAEKRDILIVDDDMDFATQLADRLNARGSSVTVAATAAETVEKLQERPLTDIVLLDIELPDTSGMDLIHEINKIDSSLPIIMVTGDAELDTAVDAIKRGAYDYVVKPIDFEPFWLRVEKAIESHRALRSLKHFEREMSESYGFSQFIYASDVMQATVDHLKQLANSDATVLVTGESGVGKELAAKTLHFNGSRRMGPFVAVSCAAVPETLIENELFGHEKGSYTDAHERQIGKFEQANGGTIFLDEIGELSPMMQTKLLRVLQERSFHRIGGVKEIKVDVRVICATNRDLSLAVQHDEFRADLFYRISVLPVMVPPLRDRQEDIVLLAERFLAAFSEKTGKPFEGFSDDALHLMRSYSWPGNVRELQNAIERAVVFGKPPLLQAKDISLGPLSKTLRKTRTSGAGVMSLKDMEAGHISSALTHFGWNISKAAQHLGIGRDTLYRKIKQYDIKQKS